MLIMHRAVPDLVGARACDRGVCRHIGTLPGPVHAHTRHEDTLGTVGIDQRQRNDRRHLLQQAQAIDLVPVVLALLPGKLNHPAELVADSVGESLDPVRGRAGLDLKPFIEIDAAVAKGEPGFDRRAKQQRRHHCDEQGDEILQKQRAARTGHGSDVR